MIRVLKGGDGYDVAYRIDGDRIKKGGDGYDVAYRIDGGRILKGGDGYDVAYRIDGNRILKGSDGYDVAFRLDRDSKKEEPSGCLGMILAFFGLIFIHLPIPGKICAIAGVVLAIVGTITSGAPGSNVIFYAPIGFLLGGGIGALGNLIIPKIKAPKFWKKMSKAGKIGMLIGIGYSIVGFIVGIFQGTPDGMVSGYTPPKKYFHQYYHRYGHYTTNYKCCHRRLHRVFCR
jgi:hypothetical protein